MSATASSTSAATCSPPLGLDRLKILGPDLLALELKRPWRDGTTHVSMSVSTFLGRLASLLPRPRAKTTVHAGVLAAHANDRATITPHSERKTARAPPEHASSAAGASTGGAGEGCAEPCGAGFAECCPDGLPYRRLHVLLVVCGTSCSRAASITPSDSASARISSRCPVVAPALFRCVHALPPRGEPPSDLRGFRPRLAWQMVGKRSYRASRRKGLSSGLPQSRAPVPHIGCLGHCEV